LVAVGRHVHEWAVIKLFYFHEIGAATGAQSSAFQPVFTRYKLLEIERTAFVIAPTATIAAFLASIDTP
jgi:hypothetical protein